MTLLQTNNLQSIKYYGTLHCLQFYEKTMSCDATALSFQANANYGTCSIDFAYYVGSINQSQFTVRPYIIEHK